MEGVLVGSGCMAKPADLGRCAALAGLGRWPAVAATAATGVIKRAGPDDPAGDILGDEHGAEWLYR